MATCPIALKGLLGEFSQKYCPFMDHERIRAEKSSYAIVTKCRDYRDMAH